MQVSKHVPLIVVAWGVSCLLLASSLAWSAEPPPRPNVVYLLADDLGWGDVGFHGGEIKTPNLDRLAASGARLEQFYVQSVCSPTRAALMTGKYPSRLGLHVGVVRPWAQFGLPLEEEILPQSLQKAGYQTAIVGKWHLGHFQRAYLPTSRGFHQQYGHYNGAIDYDTHQRDGGLDWHRNDKALIEEGYSTHLLANEAVRIVAEHNRAKPLFLYVPFNAVHAPHQVPPKYSRPYEHLAEPRRTYAGMLAALDEAVGQIVTQLEKSGLSENTLIIFHSDNGGPNPGEVTSNGPLRGSKATLYEGGVRVPAFAVWPKRIAAGSVVNQPLHVVDWNPTLRSLAGVAPQADAKLDGKDAWGTIAEGEPSPHDEILLNATPTAGAIRVGDWKLLINATREHNDGQPPAAGQAAAGAGGDIREPVIELFDLAKDPHEKVNLAERHPDKVRELRTRYEAFLKQAVPPRVSPKPAGFQSPKVWGESS